MAIKLNKKAFDKAKRLVSAGQVIRDQREAWSQHQPVAKKENEFIRQNGYQEYARWHLGIDDSEDEETKARYKFPYGDLKDVHRCGVIAAEIRAAQYKYSEVEKAAAHLHEMIDAVKE